MIPYKYLSLKQGTPAHKGAYWDFTLLDDILADNRFNEVSELTDGGLIIFPARAQAEKIKDLNKYLSKLKWWVLFIVGDEEAVFPIEKVDDSNGLIYVMSPKQNRHEKYKFLPNGYTPHTRANLGLTSKATKWIFQGQVTHERRATMAEKLRLINSTSQHLGIYKPTDGFTKGDAPDIYIRRMCDSIIAVCPSGPVTADTFRLYEALEAGCIPIADSESKTGTDYWNFLFGNHPFPQIKYYSDLPGYINDNLEDWKHKANRIQAWWIKYKRDLKIHIINDVAELSGLKPKEAITAVIPVSPIKSHPSIHILEETVKSIRHHMDTEIIITFDGIRKEQENRRDDYQEFIRRALFKCNTEWNAVPFIFDEHTHQSGMLKAVIDEIQSPLLMYVEQDTPLVIDEPIDFRAISTAILNGGVSHVRFSHEALILDDHKHLMLDNAPINVADAPLVRTIQYSQRPHVASVAYYRQLLSHFSEDSKSFLEDLLHGVIHEAYVKDGMQGWQNNRLAIYHPEGNIKRSYHLDGREGEAKYDDRQVF